MSLPVLLPLLADGEFRSGQQLADALGVSRTAVWKQLNKFAEETGVEIESVRGRGYRITGGLDLLDSEAVTDALDSSAQTLLRELIIAPTIDSTNAELMRRAQSGASGGLVCVAEQQSAGRGRRGRTWVSPFAGNLYLSILWDFDSGAAALEGLSLAVGVAVSRALGEACDVEPALKWPNDIQHAGKKLGGILLEMSGDADGRCQVVVGIGLNVAMPKGAAREIDQAWTDLRTLVPDCPPRSALLAALLNELLPLLEGFEAGGFAPWRDAWQSLDAYAGQRVVLDTGAAQMAGIARGVDDRGALQLETTTGVQSVYGGEISLRGAT